MKNIELTKKEGVVLDTSEKYCDDYIYVYPKLQNKEITSNGTAIADDGYVGLGSVTVNVSTTVELPTLNAPIISLNNSILTITNPETNGNFVTNFKVYKGSTLLTSTANTSIDLSSLITELGTYAITVRASGTNFNDSAASNSISYTVVLPELSTPTISLVSGTTIQIDTIDDNATTIEVFADSTSIGEVAKQAGSSGETWVFNETPQLPFSPKTQTFITNFTSKGESYGRIDINNPAPDGKEAIYYNATPVLDSGLSWIDEGYRTIILEQPATGDLLAMLTKAAVKQTATPKQ